MSFIEPTEQEQANIMTSANPASSLQPDSWFSGVPTAAVQGVTGALGSVGQLALDASNAYDKLGISIGPDIGLTALTTAAHTLADQYIGLPPKEKNKLSGAIQGALDQVQDWSKVDPRTQGAGAQLAAGLTRGLTLAGAGAVTGGALSGGAALASSLGAGTLMGATEANTAYNEATENGVDNQTAAKLAGVAAITNFGGAFLPMHLGGSGVVGMAKSILYGAGVNATIGAGNRFAISSILDNNGYTEMANQYKVLDANAIAADALLGAAFGGVGKYLSRPNPDQIHSATEVLKGEQIDRAGPGIPVTPDAANAHNDVMAQSVMDLEQGRLPVIDSDMADTIANGVIEDPVRAGIMKDSLTALEKESPETYEFSKPVEMKEPEAAASEPEMTTPLDKSPTGVEEVAPKESASTLNPQAVELLKQLHEKYPDLEVPLGDGTTAKVSDLPDLFQKQMDEATKLSTLHDIAIACLMGSE